MSPIPAASVPDRGCVKVINRQSCTPESLTTSATDLDLSSASLAPHFGQSRSLQFTGLYIGCIVSGQNAALKEL